MKTFSINATPSNRVAGAIARFRVSPAPFAADMSAAQVDAAHGGEFQPRWFRALPVSAVAPRRSARGRNLDLVI
ncbi:hypothetical protein [Saccharopolyspora hordei]|uniref:Uncharacterized protein n=1 Tax=Saccharopolyspora hordei TaxID=1838 RepID=A0A853AUX9_9PSEU|nr:hypothetical protein [Saccharopolyspora hordei]NYI86457.1 hypothetical protein [Saccharopolyspora hordei]